MRTLVVDNYDSFTWNLVHLLADVNGEMPVVIRNDEATIDEIISGGYDAVVLSPGPGHPENARDFGISTAVARELRKPILGVCLGYQGIAAAFGARVGYAPEPMHGRISRIRHTGAELFQGIPQGFEAVRYHSLAVEGELPECLEALAWSEDGVLMALRHRTLPIWGVQFHPEAICTAHGRRLLDNFRTLAGAHSRSPRQFGKSRKSAAAAPRYETHVHWIPDLDPDPEQVFAHLFSSQAPAFWLDSAETEAGHARFSFMGDASGPRSKWLTYRVGSGQVMEHGHEPERTVSTNLYEYLSAELEQRRCNSEQAPFQWNCGFVGYFSYELKAECGSRKLHAAPTPDAALILADHILVFDHEIGNIYLVCLTEAGGRSEAEEWFAAMEAKLRELPPLPPPALGMPLPGPVLSRPREQYIVDVRRCLDRIRDGESYELCLTDTVRVRAPVDPFEFYRRLRRTNPAPYAAFLRFPDFAVACSSPERFLRVTPDGMVESRPIKGTVGRGASPAEDLRLRESLRNSPKERAENMMIVDLVRNDLSRVCEPGSVHVPGLMEIETYRTVHQMVSTIRGCLREGSTAIDCLRAAFPGGSMTGAPKIRTMEILDELEGEARGVYSGAIGYLALNGSADLNIVIRTAVIRPDEISIGAGGAVTALSDPEAEYEEMMLKAQAVLNALVL